MNRKAISVFILLIILISTVLVDMHYQGIQGRVNRESRVSPWVYGEIVSVQGDRITSQLWSGMKILDAGDGSIKWYLGWLRGALGLPGRDLEGRHGYLGVFDSRGFRAEIPGEQGMVKVGVIMLPFGGALIVTAYSSGGRIFFAVHGLILDYKRWETLLSRVAFAMGWPYPGGGRGFGSEDNYPLVTGGVNEVYNGFLSSNMSTVRVGWVLWRINLTGESYVLSRDGLHAVDTVYVLLEMPVYRVPQAPPGSHGWVEWWQAEAVYWSVIGYPALSLAVNLAVNGWRGPLGLYASVPPVITRNVVLTGVSYPNVSESYVYSTRLRWRGAGVCNEQSRASSMFASNALGAASAYAGVGERLYHAVSIEVLPSSLYGQSGPVALPFDSDGDGVNDTGVVLVDTAHMEPGALSRSIVWWYSLPEMPLAYSDVLESLRNFWLGLYDYNPLLKELIWRWMLDSRYLVYPTLAPLYVSRLPGWLEMPWAGLVLNATGYNPVNNTVKGFEVLGRLWYIGSIKRQLLLASQAFADVTIHSEEQGATGRAGEQHTWGLGGCNWSITPPPYIVLESISGKLGAAFDVAPPPSMGGMWDRIPHWLVVGNFTEPGIAGFNWSELSYWELSCSNGVNDSRSIISTVPPWNASPVHTGFIRLVKAGDRVLEGSGVVDGCPVRVVVRGLDVGWVIFVYVNNRIAGRFYSPMIYRNNTLILSCLGGLTRLSLLYNQSVVHVDPRVFSLKESLVLHPVYRDRGGLRWFKAYRGSTVMRGVNLTLKLEYISGDRFRPIVFLDGRAVYTGLNYSIDSISQGRSVVLVYHSVRLELNPAVVLNNAPSGLVRVNASNGYSTLNIVLGNGSIERVVVDKLDGTARFNGTLVTVNGLASSIWGNVEVNLTGLPIYPYNVSSYLIIGKDRFVPINTSYRFVDGILELSLHYNFIGTGRPDVSDGCCILVRVEPLNLSIEIPLTR